MEKVSEIIKNKKIIRVGKPLKITYERYWNAKDLSKKFGLDIKIMLRLLKRYTFSQISSIYSWWADYPLKEKNNIGLLIWRLKELYPRTAS